MLLDWSKRARFAAYFAAAEVAQNELPDARHPRRDLGSHLAVWALRGVINVSMVPRPRPDQGNDIDELEVYQAPGGTNPNMRAQAGVFTCLVSTIDTTIEEHAARWHDNRRVPPWPPLLKRLTLPHAEARKLLRLLALEGVDGAAMFPGADGVARAMHERSLWDQPDERIM